jgi:vacuolar-type H+-ATPase subunit I/STV1
MQDSSRDYSYRDKSYNNYSVDQDDGEDQLLIQIDKFRDKAKQLQSLINAKERKVKELEAVVRTKEEKNQELQEQLIKKQKEADSLVNDVNGRVDDLIDEVRHAMEEMSDKLKSQVNSNEDSATKQTMAVQDTLNSMNESLGKLKSELSDKVHTENVKVYRNLQDLINEKNDNNSISEDMDKSFRTVKHQNVFLIILSILNLAAVAAFMLIQFGFI